MARGKATVKLGQKAKGFPKNGNTAAKPTGHFPQNPGTATGKK